MMVLAIGTLGGGGSSVPGEKGNPQQKGKTIVLHAERRKTIRSESRVREKQNKAETIREGEGSEEKGRERYHAQ